MKGFICGSKAYAEYPRREPDKCRIVAIAEPRPQARAAFAKMHSVTDENVFDSWQDLYTRSSEVLKSTGKRLADAVVVAVQDRMHCEVVCAFAEQGYDILCEKPMGTSVQECVKMAAAVTKAGVIFGVGHGKYGPFRVKDKGSAYRIYQCYDIRHITK